MDRSLAPYFMNNCSGHWRWSERAGKYFWVKWEGEKGGYHLPQFNFGDPGWQAEVAAHHPFLVGDRHGWDGHRCGQLVHRLYLGHLPLHHDRCHPEAENQFCQPEGAGGFKDDPVSWIEQGGWNCIMDYSIKLWWEGVDVIRRRGFERRPASNGNRFAVLPRPGRDCRRGLLHRPAFPG